MILPKMREKCKGIGRGKSSMVVHPDYEKNAS